VVALTNPSLEAVNLSKHFNSFVAVSDLNLKIEGSKCIGFLGPNGAGKNIDKRSMFLVLSILISSLGSARGFSVFSCSLWLSEDYT
jgi:ABC-type uncharacterized transport system ATPase subunit